MMTGEVKQSLADEVFGRRNIKKKKSLLTKPKSKAVPYTAAEIYRVLDSVRENFDEVTEEVRHDLHDRVFLRVLDLFLLDW